jgi:hypothetical protein
MDINTTTVVNGADGTSFDMPGAWEATQVQSNYSPACVPRSKTATALARSPSRRSPALRAKSYFGA